MQPTSKAGRTKRDGQAGYTYIAMLIVLVGITLAAQVSFVPSATVAKRQKEAEIIFQGRAYRDAIGSYWRYDEPDYPSTLEDLLNDPRADGVRHIRRLYAVDDWGLDYGENGIIQGVFPKQEGTPLKQGNFPPDLTDFEAAESYADWIFRFVPEAESEE